MKTRRFRINNFHVTSDLGEFVRFYRVLKIFFIEQGVCFIFSFNFKIIELNMSSKSDIYCCVPGCTQKGTVDPEGNRVGFFDVTLVKM